MSLWSLSDMPQTLFQPSQTSSVRFSYNLFTEPLARTLNLAVWYTGSLAPHRFLASGKYLCSPYLEIVLLVHSV